MREEDLRGDGLRRWLPPDPAWKVAATWRKWMLDGLACVLVIVAAVLVLIGVAIALRHAVTGAHAAEPQISLFATICIDGTLHGLPDTQCREFQIGHYSTIDACNSARKGTVADWLAGVAFLSPHLVAERCGPTEPDPGDDI